MKKPSIVCMTWVVVKNGDTYFLMGFSISRTASKETEG